MNNPFVILSDSDVLIKSIEWVFRERFTFTSAESLERLEVEIAESALKLVIVDMDIIKETDSNQLMDSLLHAVEKGASILFLVSEKAMLNFDFDFDSKQSVSSDWLVKPYSRNAMVSAVQRLCSQSGHVCKNELKT